MNIKFELILPSIPDTISYKVPPRPRAGGFTPGGNQIKIEELTEEQANEYAEEVKQAFLKHYREKKENK